MNILSLIILLKFNVILLKPFQQIYFFLFILEKKNQVKKSGILNIFKIIQMDKLGEYKSIQMDIAGEHSIKRIGNLSIIIKNNTFIKCLQVLILFFIIMNLFFLF